MIFFFLIIAYISSSGRRFSSISKENCLQLSNENLRQVTRIFIIVIRVQPLSVVALKAAKLPVEYQKSGVSEPEGPFENAFTGMKHIDSSLCRELRGLRCILDKVSRKEHLTEQDHWPSSFCCTTYKKLSQRKSLSRGFLCCALSGH